MADTHIPKLTYEYTPTGERNIGGKRERWSDLVTAAATAAAAEDSLLSTV
jgi:hypothetical protein